MKLTITIDNKTYEVEVEAAENDSTIAPASGYAMGSSPVRISSAPPPVKPAETGPVNESKVCRSPVSGIVMRVGTQAGQILQIGDVLLVLEAMKMETTVTSPVAGKVAAINVNSGEAVKSGQIVVEFE